MLGVGDQHDRPGRQLGQLGGELGELLGGGVGRERALEELGDLGSGEPVSIVCWANGRPNWSSR